MKKIKKATLLLALAALLAVSSCTPNTDSEVQSGNHYNTENNENTDNTENTENSEDTENTENNENNDNIQNNENNRTDESENAENPDSNQIGGNSENQDKPNGNREDTSEISADRWIIPPSYVYDSLETFGKTGYSIYRIGEKYGILDMNASGIGTGDYSELFYCPTHGLSCPDILDTPVRMREDLYLAPDCGYEYDEKSEVIYVFDPTRDRVYATGYSDGYFRIADITDTEFFKSNERYIAVLYDCDADIMMYEGIGMRSLADVYQAETKEMKYGVIDSDMDYVIACIYDEVRDGNDCYIVKKDGKYGYRAVTGREYYPCVFEYANTAFKGAAWVKYNGKWGTVRF